MKLGETFSSEAWRRGSTGSYKDWSCFCFISDHREEDVVQLQINTPVLVVTITDGDGLSLLAVLTPPTSPLVTDHCVMWLWCNMFGTNFSLRRICGLQKRCILDTEPLFFFFFSLSGRSQRKYFRWTVSSLQKLQPANSSRVTLTNVSGRVVKERGRFCLPDELTLKTSHGVTSEISHQRRTWIGCHGSSCC